MAKKNSMAAAVGGGILMLIGSLLYLYIGFAWYGAGSAAGPWLAAAQFFSPFVAAFAFIGAITLFFMSIGAITMRRPESQYMTHIMWSFITLTGLVFLIVTAGSSWFYVAVLAFVIGFIGAIVKSSTAG